MAGRFSVPEWAKIAARCEVWNWVVAVQRWWREVRGRNATVHKETVKKLHSRLLTRILVTDVRSSGRPFTSRSEENVALVRDKFIRSPLKLTRQAARGSGLSRHTVRTGLKWRHENSPTCTPLSAGAYTLAGTKRTSRMAYKKSRFHALWLFPVRLGEWEGVLGKIPHNGTIGEPDL
jgi:hypothetical protein